MVRAVRYPTDLRVFRDARVRLAVPHSPDEPLVSEPQPEPRHPVVVVVAEDEDIVRQAIARALGAEGYRILEARDGAEALHLVHLTWPHLQLVITDVVMPSVDGLELGRRLSGYCPGLPVLYMSAYANGDIFNRGGPGADAPFIQKPFSHDDLSAKVRDLLAGRRQKSGEDAARSHEAPS